MTDRGARIKEIRIKRGLSQEDLAELSKVNLRTIQRIENNEASPREKTLRLIYDALDIEVIEQKKTEVNRYFVWSSFLTLLVIVSTFLGWIRFTQGYFNGNKVYKIYTGWDGYTLFNDYEFYNWLLSISSISVGLIVMAHSLKLINKKFKYIALQLIIMVLYLLGVFSWSFIQAFEFRPGLFLVVLSTVLLLISFKKSENIGKNNS